jgi:hypothetical protein
MQFQLLAKTVAGNTSTVDDSVSGGLLRAGIFELNIIFRAGEIMREKNFLLHASPPGVTLIRDLINCQLLNCQLPNFFW